MHHHLIIIELMPKSPCISKVDVPWLNLIVKFKVSTFNYDLNLLNET